MLRVIRFILIFGLFIWFSFWWNIDINDIYVRFCNDSSDKLDKRVSLYNKAWEKTRGCIFVVNKSDNTWYIDLHFVSQVNSSQWKKACAIPGNQNDIFSKYIRPSRSGLVYLWPKEELEKNFELNFPVWMWWVQWWCLAFFIAQKNKGKTQVDWTLLSLITRKASLFEVWIDDAKSFVNKIKTEKIWKSKRVLLFLNWFKSQIIFDNIDKTLVLRIKVSNDWNLNQKLHLSWNIYSFFGFKGTFDIRDKILEKDAGLIFDTKSWWIALNIPEYHWLFWLKLNLWNQPYFDFDTSRIPDEKLSWSNSITNIVFFVISRVSVGFWLLIILFIFTIYRATRKRFIIKK